ncbi:rRNA-binding ribosome biosynthesis protein RPF1 [Fusarium oxysporum Fo47]|nr:rRNA-binding ribosome biosynthesis protein RPF1 [Fusarium oxysporum Fo47]WJG36014.1 anticodon-binding protein [Fusarium oxysporum Fo47]
MGFTKPPVQALKSSNKLKRKELFVQYKKHQNKERHEERHRRRREEAKDPELKAARLAKRKPATIDSKRVWDDIDDDSLGVQVDLEKLKRRRIEEAEAAEQAAHEAAMRAEEELDEDDDVDSMLASDEEMDEERQVALEKKRQRRAQRDNSVAPSTTSTNLDLTPTSLALKFPSLFTDIPAPEPKILVTTSINSTLHEQAHVLCEFFPNSSYVPRSAHRYGHKYSLREICKYASNREHTAVILLKEDSKKPTGLTVVHLPSGPTFHFSITNWIEGKKLPGHGNPTNHYPELLLNNFKTPLGLLTAKLFMTLFPPKPEFQGRQVTTLHNQRDYIFVRRHRYVFREKRQTEKSIVSADGKEVKGVEGIRAGLQELGPRFTLKLRRVDKGIGRAGSEGDDATQWEWKAKMEKDRKSTNITKTFHFKLLTAAIPFSCPILCKVPKVAIPVYDTSALAEVAFKENTLTSALPIKETVAQCLTMDSGFHISRPNKMASVDPPYLRFRMFYFFTKRIICEDPPAMRDLFDEDHIIFLAGLSLSGCYIRIQRTFSLLIKKLVRGPMDELQADYEDYIRSRSQHPVEFQNV